MKDPERRARANRENARRSTGPRTTAGKSRASRNALRHGLAAADLNSERAPRVDALARIITGSPTGTAPSSEARDIADASLELVGIRALRLAMISRAAAELELDWPSEVPLRPDDEALMALAFERAAADLMRLERYERRALSRRKMAVRRLR